jgi:predicted ATPase
MGLHTGSPSVAAEGYVGIDVHRGARVAALAHGDQVILSATTAALVENQPLRDLGRHRLKDFDAPAQLFQLGTREFPPLRTPGAVDLPTPATQFLGRERELFDAASLWLERDPRLLTIVGPGGTGKTRFSIELARFLADEADGGTVFVPLAPVRDAALVVPLIAAHLGASGDTADAIATRLGDKQAHVVLDNLEQLLPAAARAIAALLAAAPSLRIVATSREPLRIAGEVELDLPPMVEADGVTLFLDRAQAIRPDVGDSPAVHELIRRLDGLPLAIELAAARVKLLGPEQLLERIGQRLDLLKGGRDADERHATLRATIAWSYDLLDEEEQTLFARLAVFPGGATLDNTENVCGADLDTLASLLDKSLVRRRLDADGEERFWMLETIREFAGEQLVELGDEDKLRRSQAELLIALADRAGTRAVVDLPRAWEFDLVAPEMDNVRAVLDWAVIRDPVLGLRLASWLEAYWVVRDPVEGSAWLERFLSAASDAEPELRAAGLRALGGTSDILGDSERAEPCYREGLALFTAAGNDAEAAHMRFRIGANMVMRGHPEEAWPMLEESLRESRAIGMRVGESQALGFLVRRAYWSGDLEAAIALALESAEIAREVGWTWWEAGQILSVAEIERERGELDAAESYAVQALGLAAELRDRRMLVFSEAELAVIAAARGDAARAGRLWGAVEAEASHGRVGQWERERETLEALVLSVDGPEFARGRAEGEMLTITQAAGLDPVADA